MSTNIENLDPEVHEKFHRFIDGVNALVDEVFDAEADHPAIVVGVQFGDMGRPDNEGPTCLVTSNLPVCITPGAVQDMLDFANSAHDEHHGMPVTSGEGVLKEPLTADQVPEEIRQKAIEWAESMGFSADDITFVEVADVSDLDAAEGVPTLFDVDDEQPGKESGE